MDPLLAARRLPALAARAMRGAIVSALAHRRLSARPIVDDALLRFEQAVSAPACNGLRPALLFSERDRIVRELRTFIEGRLAVRLASLRRSDLIAVGRVAAPFDALVRNRRGRVYALVVRRLPSDGRRLEVLRRIRAVAERYEKTPLCGVLVYDLASGSARLVRASRITSRAA